VAWEVEVWFFFKVGMWDFLIFQGIIFWGMEKFQHKNLVERTNNILFKTEHLIHLTNNNINFFFLCLIFLMYMIKKIGVKKITIIHLSENENNG
jgi:hypothetical protein